MIDTWSSGVALASPLLELYWQGFTALSSDLARSGWDFRVDTNLLNESYSVIFQSPDHNVRGCTAFIQKRVLEQSKYTRIPVPCRITMAQDVVLNNMTIGNQTGPIYQSVDMEYRMVETRTALSSLFAPKQELIIPSLEVPELLDRILEIQQPERQKYLLDKVRQQKTEVLNTAKIVNFG